MDEKEYFILKKEKEEYDELVLSVKRKRFKFLYYIKNIFIIGLPVIVYLTLGPFVGFTNVILAASCFIGQFIFIFFAVQFMECFDSDKWIEKRMKNSNEKARLKYLKKTNKTREQLLYIYEETEKEDESLTKQIRHSIKNL